MNVVEGNELEKQIEAIKAEIKQEYRMPHQKPWIVGFSGSVSEILCGRSYHLN